MKVYSILIRSLFYHVLFNDELSIFFQLKQVVNLSYARKDMGDYWKNMMNGQPMPEAIKDLIAQDAVKDHFIREFDIRPNVILYHTHVPSNKHKHHAMAIKIEEFEGTGRHG